MSISTAHTAPSQHSIIGALVHWSAVRLGVYLVTPVVSMAFFAAGAAFYRYAWQGPPQPAHEVPTGTVPPPIEIPAPVRLKPTPTRAAPARGSSDDMPAVALGVPQPRQLWPTDAPRAVPSEAAIPAWPSQYDIGSSAHSNAVAYVAAPPAVQNIIGNTLPIAEVVSSVPVQWQVVGLQVVNTEGGVVGNVQGVKANSGRQEVFVRLTNTKTVSVHVRHIGWLPNENGPSPLAGVLYDRDMGAK